MTRKEEIIQAALIQEGVNTDKGMECFMLGASQVGSTIIEQIEQCLTDSDDVDDICYAYHRIEGKIKELKGE